MNCRPLPETGNGNVRLFKDPTDMRHYRNNGSAGVAAVTVESGVQFSDLYPWAMQNGHLVIGGTCDSVGVGGCWYSECPMLLVLCAYALYRGLCTCLCIYVCIAVCFARANLCYMCLYPCVCLCHTEHVVALYWNIGGVCAFAR